MFLHNVTTTVGSTSLQPNALNSCLLSYRDTALCRELGTNLLRNRLGNLGQS